mgnify:CR=1 FL=1
MRFIHLQKSIRYSSLNSAKSSLSLVFFYEKAPGQYYADEIDLGKSPKFL